MPLPISPGRPLLCGLAILLTLMPCFGNIALSDLFADHIVLQRNREIPIEGTATPGRPITVALAGHSEQATVDPKGHWSVKLPSLPAGGPYEVKISGDGEDVFHDVLIGDVWLASGQSNMNFHMAPYPPWTEGVWDYEKEIAGANDPGLRVFTVPIEASHIPLNEIHGVWQTCTPQTAGNFYAVTYYFARRLREETKIPIAIIQSARGGTSIVSWMDRATLEQLPGNAAKLQADDRKIAESVEAIAKFDAGLPEFRKKSNQAQLTDGNLPAFLEPYPNYGFRPSYLYNAMIHPLIHFPVKGFLWWQAESDMLWAKAYPAYFKALITSWRAQWNEPDAPFLFVQIAGHDPMQDPHPQPNQVGAWAAQRLAQATALELPHTAMATAADAGDSVRVHTRDKKTVGTRLALAGLALAYGKDIPYRGPRVKSTRMEQDKVVLDLDTDGVALKSVPAVTGFELAGADGVFHAATATLKGNSVTVSSPEVTAPAQVRYAFADLPYLSVYDTNGLPLPPFGQTVEPK